MILGILQCGHVPAEVVAREGTYTDLYAAMFPGRGYDIRTFSVVDGAFPSGPEDADAWLVSGSRHGAYEEHDWIPPLEALLRDIRDTAKPMVGICFGHQIIAQAFGGRVEKSSEGWIIGRQSYQLGSSTIHLNAWHQDQVVDLPPGAELLGASETCRHAFVSYGPNILTMQPHPEFGSSVVDILIDCRGKAIDPARTSAARSALGAPDDNAQVHRWIADTLEGALASQVPQMEASS